jgi:hypothetical protein
MSACGLLGLMSSHLLMESPMEKRLVELWCLAVCGEPPALEDSNSLHSLSPFGRYCDAFWRSYAPSDGLSCYLCQGDNPAKLQGAR